MNVKENAIERDEHKIWGNRGKLCSRVKGGGYRDEGGALSVLDDGRAVMGLLAAMSVEWRGTIREYLLGEWVSGKQLFLVEQNPWRGGH